MLEFDKIPYPIEILFVDEKNKIIIYKNKKRKILKFDAKKLRLNKKDDELVNRKFEKVRIEADGFFGRGKNDIDEVYIGKDTIYDYSDDLSVDAILT